MTLTTASQGFGQPVGVLTDEEEIDIIWPIESLQFQLVDMIFHRINYV